MAKPSKSSAGDASKSKAGGRATKSTTRSSTRKTASGKVTRKKTSARSGTSDKASAAKKKAPAKKKAATKKATSKKKTTTKSAAKKSTAQTSTAKPTGQSASKRTTKATRSSRGRAAAARSPALGRAAASVDGPVHNSAINGEVSLSELSQSQLKRAKSGLRKKDLEFFRDELLERRAEILGDVANLDAARSHFGGEISNMPLHMADVGSEHYDREFNLGLLESEKKLLREIDEALLRIPNKTYGVCHVTGKPIERIRLEIKPWAKYCIEVVRERERRGLPT